MSALQHCGIELDCSSSTWIEICAQPAGRKPSHGTDAKSSGALTAAFELAVSRFPDRAMMVTRAEEWSYGVVGAMAAQVAARLKALPEFSAGDRVVLLLKNSPEYVAAFYGVLRAGGVVVPMPPETEVERLQKILHACEPRVVFTSPPGCRHLRAADGTIRWSLGGDCEMCEGAESIVDDRSPDDLAAIFFTSGSTGDPKGVMLSENNLLSNARAIVQYLGLGDHERPLALLPFYHAFGNSILQSHLLCGGTLILDGSPLFPQSILDAMQSHRATSFSGVPELFHMLLQKTKLTETGLPHLQYMAVAGGGLPRESVLELHQAIAPAKLFVMYGQTEATARLSYLPPECLPEKAGSIGRGIPGTVIEVVDDQGRPVPPGVQGCVRARGPGIMLGYWRDEAATRVVLNDGWLHTGDLAVVDDDGFVYPQGRENALMKVFGHRVHPAEIEQFVLEQFSVARVIAVPFEDAECNTRIALFIQAGESVNAEGLVEAVLSKCRKHLPSYKAPSHVELIEQLPLNASLKLDRPHLAREARRHYQSPQTRA